MDGLNEFWFKLEELFVIIFFMRLDIVMGRVNKYLLIKIRSIGWKRIRNLFE